MDMKWDKRINISKWIIVYKDNSSTFVIPTMLIFEHRLTVYT